MKKLVLIISILAFQSSFAATYLSEECYSKDYKLSIYKPNAKVANYQLTYLKTGQSVEFSQKNYLVTNTTSSKDIKIKILHETRTTNKEKGMKCSFLTESWKSKLNFKVVNISKSIQEKLKLTSNETHQMTCDSTKLQPVAIDFNRQMMKVCDLAPSNTSAEDDMEIVFGHD